MRERYRVLRIPRRASALREALLQVAAEAVDCPTCASLILKAGQQETLWARNAVLVPAAGVAVRTDRCRRCRGKDRAVLALAFSEDGRTRLLVDTQEAAFGYMRRQTTALDLYSEITMYKAHIFLPLLRLLGRLGGRRWAPMVVINETMRVLVQGRDFTPLIRLDGDRIAAERHGYVFTAHLVSPFVAFTHPWSAGLLCYSDHGARRLVEDLLTCSSEEEAEKVLALWSLSGEL